MLILNSTTKSITAKLGESADSNEPIFTASYAKHTPISFTEESNEGEFNSTSDIDIMPSPSTNERNILKTLTIFNPDTIGHYIILQYVNDSGTFIFNKFFLYPNSFYIFNPDGQQFTNVDSQDGTSDWITTEIDYTDINDVASTTKSVFERDMDINQYVRDLFVKIDTAFTGTGITAMSFYLRNNTNTSTNAVSIFTSAGDKGMVRANVFNLQYQTDVAAVWPLYFYFVAASANLNALSAGHCKIIYRTAYLP